MSGYHSHSKDCCSHYQHGGCTSVVSKLVDAHFDLCRFVTHSAIDCIESFLNCCDGHDSKGCVDSMCCEIPEPCWMPKLLGDYCCEICDGGKVSLSLWITNEDYVPRTYKLSRRGDTSGTVSFSTTEITLQAKERAKVVVTFDAPNKPSSCDVSCYDLVIWIDSCRDYYLRWVIRSSKCPKPCCLEIPLLDKPDYVMNWYDHFYCARSCG